MKEFPHLNGLGLLRQRDERKDESEIEEKEDPVGEDCSVTVVSFGVALEYILNGCFAPLFLPFVWDSHQQGG